MPSSSTVQSLHIPGQTIEIKAGDDIFSFPTPSPRLPPKSATFQTTPSPLSGRRFTFNWRCARIPKSSQAELEQLIHGRSYLQKNACQSDTVVDTTIRTGGKLEVEPQQSDLRKEEVDLEDIGWIFQPQIGEGDDG